MGAGSLSRAEPALSPVSRHRWSHRSPKARPPAPQSRGRCSSALDRRRRRPSRRPGRLHSGSRLGESPCRGSQDMDNGSNGLEGRRRVLRDLIDRFGGVRHRLRNGSDGLASGRHHLRDGRHGLCDRGGSLCDLGDGLCDGSDGLGDRGHRLRGAGGRVGDWGDRRGYGRHRCNDGGSGRRLRGLRDGLCDRGCGLRDGGGCLRHRGHRVGQLRCRRRG